MTEAQWLACSDPADLVAVLEAHGKVSTRKLRRFMAATNRRLWAALAGVERAVVEAWERYVDGQATRAELDALYRDGTAGASAAPEPGDHDAAWADALAIVDHAGDQAAE